jgi:hypothetical protein
MEGHDRLNGTRRARTASGGEVPWNRSNWLPPINSGWRVRNASACPRDPRRANFRPPVIAAVLERGIAQARSCCSAGPRNPVTKRRSHKRNDPGNDAPSPEDHAWQAAAIHPFSSRSRLRTMVTLHVSLPRRSIRPRAVLRALPASFKRRRPTSGLNRGREVVLYGRSARERAPERNCPCRSRSSAG